LTRNDSAVLYKYKRPVQPQGPTGFYVIIVVMQTILFIDGENFVKKIRTVFETEKRSKPRLDTYDFQGLLNKVLKDIKIDKTIFYFAHLKEHPDTKEKSQQLIEDQ